MSNTNLTTTQTGVKHFFEKENVKAKITELLGKRSTQFITSVLQIVNSNDLLKKATPESIYSAATMAAVLDLPLNNNLGFAYIVPYNTKGTDQNGNQITVTVAQFQMGYKGFIQLAQRTGQFKRIAVAPVHEGQLISNDPLKGYEFDWTVTPTKVIGYVSYFELLNGFESMLYLTNEELTKHAQKFSQTFKRGFGLWKDDFDSMARKTVLKLLLSKFAPLSVEMQKAVIADQAVIRDVETIDVEYSDNATKSIEDTNMEKEISRVTDFINKASTREELLTVVELAEEYGLLTIYDNKINEIHNAGN